MKNKYYKLKDFMTDAQKEAHPNGYCLMPNFSEESSEGLWSVLNTISGLTLGADTKYTRTLWCKYLWPEISSSIVWIDCSEDEAKDNMIASFAKWLNDTQELYEKIINNALNKYEDLFAKVESESFNRFNDTPQAGEYGLDDDTHATTTNKIINKTDIGTPVQRLQEVENFLKSYYKRWAQDFINRYIIL